MENKVIAYRINESLFCVKCFQKNQDLIPKESGVTLPGIPVMAEDLKTFICNECLTIFKRGDLANKEVKKGQEEESNLTEKEKDIFGGKDLGDIQDLVEDCADKIEFLNCMEPRDEIGEDALKGRFLIMSEIATSLEFVVACLSNGRRKGVFIELNKERKN